jgi:hypothetical protein
MLEEFLVDLLARVVLLFRTFSSTWSNNSRQHRTRVKHARLSLCLSQSLVFGGYKGR